MSTSAGAKDPTVSGALVLTHGLPGAGKSSLADFLQARFGNIVSIAERDEIRLELFGAQYFILDQYLPVNEDRVTELQHARIREELAQGQLVVASDTNLDPRRIRELVSIALEFDAPVFDLHLDISQAEAKARNEHRAEGGGRLVPQDVIDDMAVYGYSGERIRHFSVRFDPTLPEGFEVLIRDRRKNDLELLQEIAVLDRFLESYDRLTPGLSLGSNASTMLPSESSRIS